MKKAKERVGVNLVDSHQIGVRVSRTMLDALCRLAEKRRRPLSWEVRLALERHLEKEKNNGDN